MTTFHGNEYAASVDALDFRTRKRPTLDALGDPDRDIIPDGGRVRVSLAMMDEAQRAVADHAAATGLTDTMREIADANRASGERTAAAMAEHAAGVARHLAVLDGEARARQAMIDRDPSAHAYRTMCDELRRGYRPEVAA